MTRLAVALLVLVATAMPARADHGGAALVRGMSPLMSALVTGGLALLVGLVVVIVVMVLTRPKGDGGEE